MIQSSCLRILIPGTSVRALTHIRTSKSLGPEGGIASLIFGAGQGPKQSFCLWSDFVSCWQGAYLLSITRSDYQLILAWENFYVAVALVALKDWLMAALVWLLWWRVHLGRDSEEERRNKHIR